jgi:mediator of RNA polymerase II transcription subunit 8, fungi type
LPSFPGQSQEGLLQHLLRKKLEPRVEDWVESGRAVGLACEAIASNDDSGRKTKLTANELVELWEWAGRAANEEAKRRNWGDDEEFTLEEREGGVANVVTGLRRRLEFGEDEEEVEGDVEMEDVATTEESKEPGERKAVPNDIPPLRLEEILRFVSTGALPGSAASTAPATTGVNPLKRGRLGHPFSG